MQVAAVDSLCTVALIGNPNTGKSTLFNALAGVRQRVGNYPGVTVEKKIGHLSHAGRRFALIDLPGTYSLAPRSLDEMVAVDVLLGRRSDAPLPDAVLCIVDASNLERNLYLVSQALELGLPTVVALNMIDVARDRGVAIDLERLRQQLGVPVIAVQANRKLGLEELKAALTAAAGQKVAPRESPFPPAFREEVEKFSVSLAERNTAAGLPVLPRYLVERLLLDTAGYLENHLLPGHSPLLTEELRAARSRLAAAGLPVPAVEAMARYAWVGKALEG
ncbi:MAG TPA: FeoB small GTPase domain-containing protein, partial [Pirellulales bacterium]|nr:FeoB small GTPase domain-containing protein [Pirellulales bacterium]